MILDHRRQILAVVGSDVIIPCKSRGAPLPTITWYRNGYDLPCCSVCNEIKNVG